MRLNKRVMVLMLVKVVQLLFVQHNGLLRACLDFLIIHFRQFAAFSGFVMGWLVLVGNLIGKNCKMF